jgi:hypothetical protein
MNPFIEFTKWLFKWIGIAIAAALGLALVVFSGAWGWNWYTHDRHAEKVQVIVANKRSPSAAAKLTSDGKSPTERCSDEFPVFVGFTNDSTRTIESIWIDVSARLPGHSTNILSYDSDLKSDRIVPPGEGYGYCAKFEVQEAYRASPKVEDAVYSGRIVEVKFNQE